MEELKVIAEDSAKNFVGGFQYNGRAILNDGSVVNWNITNEDERYNSEDIEAINKCILSYCTITDKKVPQEELDLIIQKISELEEDFEEKSTGTYDSGIMYIQVYDYKRDTIFRLKEKGDWEGKNNSKPTQEIIEMLKQYL